MGMFRSEDGKMVFDKSRKRTLVVDGTTYTRVPREKPKSRATRCAEGTMSLDEVKSKLEEIRDEVTDEDYTITDLEEILKRIEEVVSTVDVSTIEELADEMENWRDNYPENLQSTDKYEAIDTAAETLREQADNLNDLTFEKIEADDDDVKDALGEALGERIDTIETAIDELNNVEFPGMFG